MNYYLIGGAIVVLLFIIIFATRKRPDYLEVETKIRQFNADYNALTQHYISTSQLRSLQDSYRSTYTATSSNKKKFGEFRLNYSNLPNLVKEHNALFVAYEVTLPLLSEMTLPADLYDAGFSETLRC